MRLVVFGGTGFIGTRVLRHALASGLRVASVSRSGQPMSPDPSLHGVEWLKGDVEDKADLSRVLDGADSVISCIGAFGSNDFMRRINGHANVGLAEAAAGAGVRRFAYISAAVFRPVAAVAPGYFDGKRIAEEGVAKHFGADGAILRPPAVYGSRQVSASVSIPIGLVRSWPQPAARRALT